MKTLLLQCLVRYEGAVHRLKAGLRHEPILLLLLDCRRLHRLHLQFDGGNCANSVRGLGRRPTVAYVAGAGWGGGLYLLARHAVSVEDGLS
jgi:hypothetical protein